MACSATTKILDDIRSLLHVAESTLSEGEWHQCMMLVGKNFKDLDTILTDTAGKPEFLPEQWRIHNDLDLLDNENWAKYQKIVHKPVL